LISCKDLIQSFERKHKIRESKLLKNNLKQGYKTSFFRGLTSKASSVKWIKRKFGGYFRLLANRKAAKACLKLAMGAAALFSLKGGMELI